MSTLLRKAVMALMGLFLCVFLVVHLGGNLILVLPPTDAQPLFNAYGELLSQSLLIKGVAWGLYAAMVAHILDGFWIAALNRRAAGPRAQVDRRRALSPWYSRQMALLGTLILVFLVVHMRDFWFVYTFGEVPVDAAGKRDLYTVVVTAFQAEWYVLLHLFAFIALGFHLLHGVFSAAQTLGLHHPRLQRVARLAGILFSTTITAGFCAVALVVHLQH